MKIKLMLLLAIFSFVHLTAKSQSFKIVNVKTSNPDAYAKIASKALGKRLMVEIFPNSLTLSIEGRQTLALRKVYPKGTVYFILDEDADIKEYTEFILHYRLNFVSSIDYKYTR